MSYPLSVVIAGLIQDNKILLIKRVKGDYIGFLALPGGKLEFDEHVSQAAVREIKEESGIDSIFDEVVGTVSELIYENDIVTTNLVLHICKLHPQSIEITNDNEGVLDWYDLDKLDEMQGEIIPSDYLMIKRMILNKEKSHFDCVVRKSDNEYVLEKFE